MNSGAVIDGVALDTQLNDNKLECIKLKRKGDGGQDSLLVLEEISTLEVCVDNPHFTMVSFN